MLGTAFGCSKKVMSTSRISFDAAKLWSFRLDVSLLHIVFSIPAAKKALVFDQTWWSTSTQEPVTGTILKTNYRHICKTNCGRHGGLVVCVLDSGSRSPGSSPGRVIALCSWARHFTLTVPLSTQEHKWVPANCQGNLTKCCDGNPAMD